MRRIYMKQDEVIKNIIIDTLKKSDVKKASIFGSVARGESNKKSDVDLLIEFKGKKSLLDLVRLKMKLEELLGRKVDILTYKSINPLIKKRILNEQKVIL